MNILVVYAHPNPKSFNHAIKETVVDTLMSQGNDVQIRDLYQLGFNPVLGASDFEAIKNKEIPEDIKEEQDCVTASDVMVFIYPLWWYDRPAILKGWFDRVFQNGFSFTYGPEGHQGLLSDKKAIIFQTAGGPQSYFESTDTVGVIERGVTDGTLGFAGITNTTIKTFYSVTSVSDQDRKDMLEEVKQILSSNI